MASLMRWPRRVYQWHTEGFALPSGAETLAHGQTFENQAFRYGQNAYGVQFHPESIMTGAGMRILENYLRQLGGNGPDPCCREAACGN